MCMKHVDSKWLKKRNSSHWTIKSRVFFNSGLILRNILLVLLRESSHPASGSFFREDEKKYSRSTASGLDERWTLYNVPRFICTLILSFHWFFFGQRENKHKVGFELGWKSFCVFFFIDMPEDYFLSASSRSLLGLIHSCFDWFALLLALIVNYALQIINNRCTTFREKLLCT